MSARSLPSGAREPISRAAPASEPSAAWDLDHIVENSYRDFHVKGFDYLCLKRSPGETIKVYFFDGDVAKTPEAVIPHDHRYAFWTDCLAGGVVNHAFVEMMGKRYRDEAEAYERFEYRTPLNGGDGFTWEREAWLFRASSLSCGAGEGYGMTHDKLHTITVRPDTVLRLVQFYDDLPLDAPTHAFRPAGKRDPIRLDGLYNRMDADHARKRLAQYLALQTAAPSEVASEVRASGQAPGGDNV
jgi:hypothetical protein